jgi:hypothetical protein
LDVTVAGRRIRVRITPTAVLPVLPDRLAATAHADAGPAS